MQPASVICTCRPASAALLTASKFPEPFPLLPRPQHSRSPSVFCTTERLFFPIAPGNWYNVPAARVRRLCPFKWGQTLWQLPILSCTAITVTPANAMPTSTSQPNETESPSPHSHLKANLFSTIPRSLWRSFRRFQACSAAEGKLGNQEANVSRQQTPNRPCAPAARTPDVDHGS